MAGSQNDAVLRDGFGRRIDYLRLSVTDRCDLRCRYCIPAGFRDFTSSSEWLSPEEIEQIARAFAVLGVRRLRLTGGEPLTRRDAIEIAARIAALPGIEDLSLTTNGTQLRQRAAGLRSAGVRRLNVSLDSLDRGRFQAITGRDALPDVLAGLEAAGEVGFDPIKINMVVMAGINDDEAEAMVDYCMARGFVLRLIEPMPIGEGGRQITAANLAAIQSRLRNQFGLVDSAVPGGGPARYQRSRDGRFSVGFITPLAQHFCAACNRVRLGANGTLFLCLGQEDTVDLKSLVRSGTSLLELTDAIRRAVSLKPERHEFNTAPTKVIRTMAMTGG